MKSENLEILKSLIKVKKLHLSEMERKTVDYTDPTIIDTRMSIMQIISTETKLFEYIVKHEEEGNEV